MTNCVFFLFCFIYFNEKNDWWNNDFQSVIMIKGTYLTELNASAFSFFNKFITLFPSNNWNYIINSQPNILLFLLTLTLQIKHFGMPLKNQLQVSVTTLAVRSSSRFWILVQGAIPMATTRTFEDVLASEWSLTAWPRCFVMPNRRPLVSIHAPGKGFVINDSHDHQSYLTSQLLLINNI